MTGNQSPQINHYHQGTFKKLSSFSFVLLSCILVSTSSFGQTLHDRISGAVTGFTSDPQMSHAITSMTILDAQTGHIIYSLNKETGLAPASCQKTITAASAFFLLGKDYKYHTKLFYDGSIHNHVLQGNIIIGGSGDPMLGTWRYPSTKMEVVLNDWIQAIKRTGIQQINGRIIGDASAFDTQMPPDGWIWQDMGNYYGAGTSALTWHENQYDLHLMPGSKTGAPVKIVRIDPHVPDFHLINELKTGKPGSGDQTYIYAAPYSHLAYVRGTSPQDNKHFTVSGSVPDPALFCATSLANALKQAGVSITNHASTVRLLKIHHRKVSPVTHLIDDHSSPRLDSIIYWFLHRSINLYGEQLVKTMALHEDTAVSTAAGVSLEKRFWEKKGINPTALNIIDGSGLSPGNRVTTHAMAEVLFDVSREKWYQDYYDCLPVIHNIRMKSGHINDVCSYAGFLTTGNGKRIIFSFIVNNYNGSTSQVRQKMFRTLDEIRK